ncbi:ATP-binding protein [bacterium]|nr:ATP-binding protein [bacterium]
MFRRILDISMILARKSLFLLGPRQTGKTTYIKSYFPTAKIYNLLEADTFRDLSQRPENIRKQLTKNDQLIIVDEIQKLPSLLDEIHLMIEANKDLRFILTGSSARKLKKQNLNLLAGRAASASFYPLVYPEFTEHDLLKRINRGGLPSIYLSADYHADLKDYIGMYLQEEIKFESSIRNIEAFSRFLTVAGLHSGELINYTNIGNDSAVPPRTVREYYQMLEDTLLGYQLPPFQHTSKRKPVATSKFYLFDVGVANALKGTADITYGSKSFGDAIEHLILIELKAYLSYQRKNLPLTFWRSLSKIEVDFVIGDSIALEVKGKERIGRNDLKGLKSIAEEQKFARLILICLEKNYRKEGNIEIFPVEKFLHELWSGEIIS